MLVGVKSWLFWESWKVTQSILICFYICTVVMVVIIVIISQIYTLHVRNGCLCGRRGRWLPVQHRIREVTTHFHQVWSQHSPQFHVVPWNTLGWMTNFACPSCAAVKSICLLIWSQHYCCPVCRDILRLSVSICTCISHFSLISGQFCDEMKRIWRFRRRYKILHNLVVFFNSCCPG